MCHEYIGSFAYIYGQFGARILFMSRITDKVVCGSSMLRPLLLISGLIFIVPGTIAGHHRSTPAPPHPYPIPHPERLVNKHFAKIYYPPSGLGAINPLIAFHDATPLNSPEKFDDYGFFVGTHYQTLAKIIYWAVKIWHFIIIVMQPFAFLAFNIAGVNYLREGINRYFSLVSPTIFAKSLQQILEYETLDPHGLDLSRLVNAKVDDKCLEQMVCKSGLETKSMIPPILLRLLDNLKLIPGQYSKLVSIYWEAASGKEPSCQEYVCEADQEMSGGDLNTNLGVTESDVGTEMETTEPDIKSNEILT